MGRFYYGKFLQLLGFTIIVAGASTTINSIFGVGVGLILLGLIPVFTKIYMEENNVAF